MICTRLQLLLIVDSLIAEVFPLRLTPPQSYWLFTIVTSLSIKY